MLSGADKIAMGVIIAVMGVATLSVFGTAVFIPICTGGLLVFMGVIQLHKERKP
jgi:hypothetical protein